MFPSYTPDWGRVSSSAGYPAVYCPDHPRAWSTGYIHIHRIMMEMKLGRLLEDGEIVHHEDEDPSNNSPENLVLTTHPEHGRKHAEGKTRAKVRLRCPQCGTEFVKETRQTHLRKPSKLGATCCSRRCRGKLSWQVRGNIPSDIQAALDANVIEHFRE